MTRILAVSDEIADSLYGDFLKELQPDLVLSCGDLPFDYLENLVSRLDRPLIYVPGNHDPDVRPPSPTWSSARPGDLPPGPQGCENADGRLLSAAGLRVAGLGGSIRYRDGPNQYTQGQMSRRALRLELRVRFRQALGRRRPDVLLTHSPARGLGDGEDPAHVGFNAFGRLLRRLRPKLLVHGHVQLYGPRRDDLQAGPTRIINAIPYRLIEL